MRSANLFPGKRKFCVSKRSSAQKRPGVGNLTSLFRNQPQGPGHWLPPTVIFSFSYPALVFAIRFYMRRFSVKFSSPQVAMYYPKAVGKKKGLHAFSSLERTISVLLVGGDGKPKHRRKQKKTEFIICPYSLITHQTSAWEKENREPQVSIEK